MHDVFGERMCWVEAVKVSRCRKTRTRKVREIELGWEIIVVRVDRLEARRRERKRQVRHVNEVGVLYSLDGRKSGKSAAESRHGLGGRYLRVRACVRGCTFQFLLTYFSCF